MTDSSAPLSRDESTRYLCAAAHLDPDFANAAIREFLVESTRAVAPSPGVNSGAVLREAIAARSRRRTRDSLLAVLLVVFAFCAPGALAAWVVVAVAACAGRVRLWRNLASARDLTGPLKAALALGVLALAAYVVSSTDLLDQIKSTTTSGSRATPGETDDNTGTLFAILAVVVFAMMAAILVADRLAVWALLTRSFRRGRFESNRAVGDRWPHEWQVRTFGHEYFAFELPSAHEEHLDPRPEAVVYRGYHPFVGAGLPYRPWSMAIPLHPRDADAEAKPFTLRELYDALERDLTGLGASPSLSPSNRLRHLTSFERVVIPADDLLVRVGDPATTPVLPDHLRRPNRHLPDDVVERITEEPLEWMRYFRCFQLETWDRDLVISAYLHLGSDQRNLYLEWTPCVLLPVRPEYQEFDELPTNSWQPVTQAFGKLLRLPVTIFGRLAHAIAWIRPIPEEPGLLLPAKYGAMASLRELAASSEVEDYFQRTDLERYVKVLGTRLIRSVGEFLEDKGLATAEFMARAEQVAGNNVHIEGSVTGNVFIGNHNKTGNVDKS
jgi:hypothetical protein